MKMVFRIDDVGYSEINDIGAFETIKNGITTSADVMLDAPHAVEALQEIRHNYPWISVGWHAHFWWGPVLAPEKVPSLLIPGTNRFRHDLQSATDISREELQAECDAQIERCIMALGRVPDVGMAGRGGSIFSDVMDETCQKYGIVTNFASMNFFGHSMPAAEKWADRRIRMANPGSAYKKIETDSITEQYNEYDPVQYYLTGEYNDGLTEEDISVQVWHPGYLDYNNYKLGDYGPNARFYTAIRVEDVHALVCDEMKQWVKDNRIELVNFRDALYGTREYQNHLKAIGSELAV